MTDPVTFLYNTETKLIKEILNAMYSGTKNGMDIAVWKAIKLKQMGSIKNVTEKMIKADIKKAIEMMREQIREKGIEAGTVITEKAGRLADALPVTADERLIAILDRYETIARDETMRLGAKLMQSVPDSVVDIIEGTTARVLAGQTTLRDGIRDTCRQWANSYTPDLIDASNRRWSTEGYSQMVLRSGIRQVTTDTQLERMNELELNLVEISSHIGARPLCMPYQGRVYSLVGGTEEYPNLYGKTSYKQPAGLFGINCRHRMYPYFPEAGKTFTIYEESLVEKAYKESQQQRYLERQLRHAKRSYETENAIGTDETKQTSKARLNKWETRLETFIDETKRTRRIDREEIYN